MPGFETEADNGEVDDELISVNVQSEVASENVETTVDGVAKSRFDKLLQFGKERQDLHNERLKEILHGFGDVGIRAFMTWKSPDLSFEEKTEGTLGAAVDLVGATLRGYFKLIGPGSLAELMPKKGMNGVDSFIDATINTAVDTLATKNPDGTYGRIKPEGLVNVLNPEGLAVLGVESVVGGVGDALRTSAKYENELNPDSKSAKILAGAQRIAESDIGKKLQEAAILTATKKINTHFSKV